MIPNPNPKPKPNPNPNPSAGALGLDDSVIEAIITKFTASPEERAIIEDQNGP